MILWKDFVLDDVLGALLNDCRDLHVTPSRVREDASTRALIQETRREAKPLQVTNTGCVRDLSRTQVQAPGSDSNLETNAFCHRDVGNEFADARSREVG